MLDNLFHRERGDVSGFKWPHGREMRQSGFKRKRFLSNRKGLVKGGKLKE